MIFYRVKKLGKDSSMVTVLSLLMVGQLCQPQVVITYEPETVYVYKLGLMQEETRFQASVRYSDGRYRSVPVINGFVPVVTYQNGMAEHRVIYDYSCRIKHVPPQLRPQTSIESLPKISPLRSKPTLPQLEQIRDPYLSYPSAISEPRILKSPTYEER